MTEPLEDAYFKWLCAKVYKSQQPSTPSLTYWKLLKLLHGTEFVWVVRGDDNRVEDGLDLRRQFITECKIDATPDWREIGCSVLEMLIAFSRRAEFQTDIPARVWFWDFLENLKLKEFNDGSDFNLYDAQTILDTFVWRTYNKKGEGGLFPIRNPKEDQRHVEIWYQFCSYLADNDALL